MKNKKPKPVGFGFIAERMGFEPTMQLPTYKLSRLAPSTTRTPLYGFYTISILTASIAAAKNSKNCEL